MEQQKILMVDDDIEEVSLIEDALLSCGQDIHYQQNGEEALQYLERCETLPCLIILDLNMPKLNGVQTLEKLKANDRFKEIPVVIYSTSINSSQKEKCMVLGANDYIVKPATYKDTLKTAEFFLGFCTNQNNNNQGL